MAAARLASPGIARPVRAEEVYQPVTAGPFTWMIDADDTMSMLIVSSAGAVVAMD